jgi:parallel beta-helix repeat protein
MKKFIISEITGKVVRINLGHKLLCSLFTVVMINSLFIYVLPDSGSAAPYNTPDTGLTLTMDNLVALSGGTVTGSSPNYEVHDDITISETDTLTINAGETIEFVGNCGLYIDGTLIAVGTEEERISFTSGQSSPAGGDWRGLVFRDKSVDEECIVKFCRIEYANNGIHIAYSSPTISNNIITNNGDDKIHDNGIFCQNGEPLIEKNEITYNIGDGIHCYGAAATIVENIVNNNTIEGIYFDSLSDGVADKNILSDNGHCGIRAYHSSSTITDNYIISNNRGIDCYRPSTPILTNNTMIKNGVGIHLGNDTSPIITQNVISECGNGVEGYWHTNGTFINCTISASNSFDFMIKDNSHLIAINTTFDKTKMYYNDELSTLTIKWYLDVGVVNDAPINGANVKVYDAQNNEIYDGFTGSNGFVKDILCTEGIKNSTATTYFTPHKIYVIKDGYEPVSSHEVTVDESKEVNIQLIASSPNNGNHNGASDNNNLILIIGIITIIIAVFVGIFIGRRAKMGKVEEKKSGKKVKGKRQAKKKRR